MSVLVRHRMGAILLEEMRGAGLGVRDLFQGRQEPLSWFFRGVAYDQSELDILEAGVVEVLHAPSALVELVVDEMALACLNLGEDGVAGYLARESPVGGGGEGADADPLPSAESAGGSGAPSGSPVRFAPDLLLGSLHLDIAPPARWLEEREAAPDANERLANHLAGLAREVGTEADSVEVHIEGALDAGAEWSGEPASVRPAGVSIYYSFELPLEGAGERQLAEIFSRGASTAEATLERMRELFRED